MGFVSFLFLFFFLPSQTISDQHSSQFDATPDTAPPAYSSPGDDTSVADETTLISHIDEPRHEPEATQFTQTTAFSNETFEDLKDQLAKAEATISSLKNEVASGLRQRKAAAAATESAEKSTATAQLAQAEKPGQQRGTEGVPVQIVAALCLASFLLAYFFF